MPYISHFFFADDYLLFFKSKMQEAKVIQDVLEAYKKGSGQAINFLKSSICFSSNVEEEVKLPLRNFFIINLSPSIINTWAYHSWQGKKSLRSFPWLKKKYGRKSRVGTTYFSLWRVTKFLSSQSFKQPKLYYEYFFKL